MYSETGKIIDPNKIVAEIVFMLLFKKLVILFLKDLSFKFIILKFAFKHDKEKRR